MRFSDLNKGKDRAFSSPAPASEPKSPPPPEPAKEQAPPPPPKASAAPAKRSPESALGVYSSAIKLVKRLYEGIQSPGLKICADLRLMSQEILGQLENDDQSLLALTRHATSENYLHAHSVNVAVLSLQTARGRGWDNEELSLLGAGALLHDIGMAPLLATVSQPRALTPQEREAVNRHPLEGEKLLGNISDLGASEKSALALMIGQEHERISGRGYPKGLKEPAVTVVAQVIGLCDVYEAMSHPRSWREAMLPHETLKAILREQTRDFDQKFVRILLDRLSLFPPGSYVELSTGEVARVAETHAQFPTRPTVEIQARADGGTQAPPLLLNLMNAPIVHITRAVDETKLAVKDDALREKLRASRWWTE